MSSLRDKLLQTIYRQFEQWIATNAPEFACQKSCATCCTQNVTMTAVEGDLIHRFINDNGLHSWFAEKLNQKKSQQHIVETTNEFAQRCLSGIDEGTNATSNQNQATCPYLEDKSCRIYEVRPFSCRSFASVKKCLPGEAAELPQFYISTTTTALQLIEHIGQGEYWGNMHDVLLALSDLNENKETAKLLHSQSMADQARARVKKAAPLPGFLISAEDYDRVSPFVLAVFNVKIGAKTVEEILNGK